jgi:hypothetical protein
MTNRPFIALGSAPCNENPAKFGDPDYRATARRECQAYIQAIRNYLGPEPVGAELDTKVFDGDKGMYYEVVCYYDEDSKTAENYARRCERQAPHTWDEGSIKPRTVAGKRMNAR